MRFSYGFDIGIQEIILPDFNFMAELNISELPERLNGEPEMRRAMAEPIGSSRLRARAQSGSKVVIISALEKGDKALPDIMPAILDELYTGGVKKDDITLLLPFRFASDPSDPSLIDLVGERTLREIKVKSIDLHDVTEVIAPDHTFSVKMYKEVAIADLRVLIGNTRYHHFLEYTGGSETLISTCCPVSSRNKLLADCLPFDGDNRTNNSTALKARYDAIANSVGENFSINMIRGTDGSIKSVCTGDVVKALKEGTRYLNAMCLKMLPCPADVVIVSAGGAPSDSDLLHALPALDYACRAVRKNGTIIFISSCKNGFGSEELRSVLERCGSVNELCSLSTDVPPEVLEASSIIVTTCNKCNVCFVCDLDDPVFDKIFPNRMPNAQSALVRVLSEASHDTLVLSMPYGNHTVPVLAKQE